MEDRRLEAGKSDDCRKGGEVSTESMSRLSNSPERSLCICVSQEVCDAAATSIAPTATPSFEGAAVGNGSDTDLGGNGSPLEYSVSKRIETMCAVETFTHEVAACSQLFTTPVSPSVSSALIARYNGSISRSRNKAPTAATCSRDRRVKHLGLTRS